MLFFEDGLFHVHVNNKLNLLFGALIHIVIYMYMYLFINIYSMLYLTLTG